MNRSGLVTLGVILLALTIVATIYIFKPEPIEGPPPHRAVYHWQTNSLDSTELETISKLKVQTVYQKLFDVDVDPEKGPIPFDAIRFNTDLPNMEMVYCVYITNQTMSYVGNTKNKLSVKQLAEKIADKVIRFDENRANRIDYASENEEASDEGSGEITNQDNEEHPRFIRLQLDCDWSLKTKDMYFALCKAIRSRYKNIKLESTVRLWQYKHREKAGIPPVERVTLMLYNMLPANLYDSDNSIYDDATARKFLEGCPPYPKPMDVAVPAFEWGIWFSNGKFKGLINAEIASNYVEDGKDSFTFSSSTTNGNYWFLAGDEIRMERISDRTLHKALVRARRLITDTSQSLIYYSLTPNLTKYHAINDLEAGFLPGR